MVRIALLATVALALALVPGSPAGGPTMFVGAVAPGLLQPTVAASSSQLALATRAGLGDAIRVELTWARGRQVPDPDTVLRLANAVGAAQQTGTRLYLAVYPYGSTQTPLTDADQSDFASWVAAIARAVPGERHFIIGNEPNLNRFWLPQFGPNGEDVAAPAYLSLLARTYDALKAVNPDIEVLGGALSHSGVDKPNTGRDTHSPTTFIQDLGTAYRASGRDRPVMDALTFHPYMLRSDQPPTMTHPKSSVITIADYDKLVALLGQAFDGTAQKGSTLPILYDEFGVESIIPSGKANLYTGSEPATVHPVDELTQGTYYLQALQLAFCQPNVEGLLVFSLQDEVNRAGWQSGLYYVDGTPKSSLAPVAVAANHVHRNIVASCSTVQVTPEISLNWFPAGEPEAGPSRFPVVVTCDVDCTYYLRLEKLPRGSATRVVRGRAIGHVGKRVQFPKVKLAPGLYRLRASIRATLNPGPPATAESPTFRI